MRWRKKPWIATAIEEYGDIVKQYPDSSAQGHWQECFGRVAPLHVELGTGRGKFIAGMAQQFPEINFIGIEFQRDVLFYAAQRIRELQLKNVRLLVFDINNLTDIFATGEIDRLYINFCDPWPKVRHAKRRLTHSRFLTKYRQVLKPGGKLFFKTDNKELFEFSLEQFTQAELPINNITYDLHHSGVVDNIMTEYEEKFSRLGYNINRCEVTFLI